MINEVSRALADFLEASSDKLLAVLGQKFTDAEAASLLKEFFNEQIRSLRGGSAFIGEWVSLFVESTRRKGGQIGDLLEAVQQTRDIVFHFCSGQIAGVSDGELYGALLECEEQVLKQAVQTFSDIERKTAAAVLRRQNTLVNSMHHAFVTLNSEGIIELSNSHFSNLLGVAEERIPGMDFVSLCHATTAVELHRDLRQKRAGVAHTFNGHLMAAQGGQTGVQFWVLPILDENGFRNGLAITMTRLESSIQFPSNTFSKLIEEVAAAVGLGLYLVDDELRVVSTNEIGRFFVEVDQLDDDRDNSQTAFSTGVAQHSVVQLRVPSQETRWVRMTTIPLRDERGKVTHLAKLALDITEEKKIEAQLLHQQRDNLVWHLAASVAHQIRNPLGVMIGFAEMLSQGMPPDRVPEAVNTILRSGMRCKEVVESLMEFGLGASSQSSMVNLNDLVQERVGAIYPDPRIEWHLAEGLPLVDCVPDQIALVLLHLVDNALRAANAKVTIETQYSQEAVTVRVHDDGPGVDEQCRARLFEPFVTTRRAEGGTGLGLCLSRRVVDLHRGRLVLDESVEDGACFVLTLPSAEQAQVKEPREEQPQAARVTSGKRILIVEDENDQLFLLALALQMQGHESDTAKTGAHAVELINANQYDAIVIDMLLGDEMGGRDLYKILQRSNPELAERTLFITGDTMKFETRRFLQDVKRPYLEKPFMVADFTAEVERVMEDAGY